MRITGATQATALDWIVAAAVCGALALLQLVLVGFAVVTDCTSEPGCSALACQRSCNATFYRHWAIAAAGLATVTVTSVPLLRRMAPVSILVASIGAGALLILFR